MNDPQPVQAGAELYDEAADHIATLTDELTRLREKVGRMEKALERCAQIVKTNLYRQHEKVEDVVLIARQALADQPK